MPYKDLEKARENRKLHAKQNNKRAKDWRLTNPERAKQKVKECHEKNPPNWSVIHRKARYGLTKEQIQELYAEQNGRCAICNKSEDTAKLVIDHDHETGVIRGLLCQPCNAGLGMFHDNKDNLLAAIAYLGG